MGKVALILRIMPESPETDLERIKEEIRNRLEISDIVEEPVAFGLRAIKISVIVEDEEGQIDIIEEKLRGIEGISSVEVEDLTLI